MIEARRVAEILGGEEILGREVLTDSDLAQLVEQGLPTASLHRAAERISRDSNRSTALLRQFVGNHGSARRKRLGTKASEHCHRLAKAIALAEFTWGDRANACEWLILPHPQLDGRSPVYAVETEQGAQAVEAILYRIIFGIPA